MSFEQIIPPELYTKTDAEMNSYEPSSIQCMITAYADETVYPPTQNESSIEGSTHPVWCNTTTDKKVPPAPPSSGDPTYSYLDIAPASCDTTSASPGEREIQYSKLSYDNMETDPTSKEHS